MLFIDQSVIMKFDFDDGSDEGCICFQSREQLQD